MKRNSWWLICLLLFLCWGTGCQRGLRSLSPPAPDTASSPSKSPEMPSFDERYLFAPLKYPAGDWTADGEDVQDVSFTSSDGETLHGWVLEHPQPKAVILYMHGNAGNVTDLLSTLRFYRDNCQCTMMVFDYRGYGRSSGVPTVQGVLRDAQAAREYLALFAGVEEQEIVLLGRSLGGAVAVQEAVRSQPRGLILESTFTSFRDVARFHAGRLMSVLVSKDKLNSLATLPDYQGPLLMSHGDADRVIPFAQGEHLFAVAGEPKLFLRLPALDHNDGYTADYLRMVERWIAQLPPVPASDR